MDVGRLIRTGVILAVAGLLAGAAPARAADRTDGPVKLTPAEFDKEVRKGAKKASEKYKGKTIELTGKVLRVTRHSSGKPLVELEAGNANAGVLCFTAEKEPWGTFVKGQTVKVTGKFPDFPVVAELEDCAVEAVTEANLRSVTAEALAKECEADPAAAGKKMEKQTLKVSGTVVARELDAKTGFTNVTLQGAGKTRVACQLIPAEKDAGAALEVGRAATVVGQYGFTFEGQVHVNDAVVLTEKK
jgi:predicted lipoprotein